MDRRATIDREACPILIAERNPRIGSVLEKAFARRGYSVRVAANGYEAAVLLTLVRPALLVLDPDLPYLFALLEAGKGTLGSTVPVILHPLSVLEDIPGSMPPCRTVCKEANPEPLLDAVDTTLSGQPAREEQQ